MIHFPAIFHHYSLIWHRPKFPWRIHINFIKITILSISKLWNSEWMQVNIFALIMKTFPSTYNPVYCELSRYESGFPCMLLTPFKLYYTATSWLKAFVPKFYITMRTFWLVWYVLLDDRVLQDNPPDFLQVYLFHLSGRTTRQTSKEKGILKPQERTNACFLTCLNPFGIFFLFPRCWQRFLSFSRSEL